MPLFAYKAQKPTGETYQAKREAPDKFALYRDVKAEGDQILSTEELHISKFFDLDKIKSYFMRVSTRDKILLARNLSSMLSAGLSLSRALSVIERQATKKNLKELVTKISESVSQGKSLSETLKQFPGVFPSLFTSMVRAGEESGSLPDSLKTISDQMNSTYTLQKKVKGAMIYPSIIISAMIVIGILMLVYVVPNITAVFAEQHMDLPWNTQIIILLSSAIKDHFVIFIAGLVALGVAVYLFKRSPGGKRLFDLFYIKLPVIGTMVKEANSARTARTLSSLLSSGVDVVQSIEITYDVIQNYHFRKVLEKTKERIKKGEQMSVSFSQAGDLYPVFFGEMVSIGEETGKLGEMLANVASYYENEVDQKTKDLSTIIEPVLMIIIGCAVAFFAVSILSPIYSLTNAM